MIKALLLVTAVVCVMPAGAQAQRRSSCCKPNPFSFAPYAGAWKDAMDISQDDENLGYMVGFRVGYDLGRRTRLIADIGYAENDDVANSEGLLNYNVYDNNWILTTGGAEYDIIPGPTSVTFGAQAGVAWQKVSLDEQVGTPAVQDQSTGYSEQLVIVPRVSIRHAFSGRTCLDASVLDYIFPDDARVKHSPALTIGFSFR